MIATMAPLSGAALGVGIFLGFVLFIFGCFYLINNRR